MNSDAPSTKLIASRSWMCIRQAKHRSLVLRAQRSMQVVLDHEGHPEQTSFVPHRMKVVPALLEVLKPGDLIITMGAGDVTAIGPELLAALKERELEDRD